MSLLPNSWHIPSGLQRCSNLGTQVSCNFTLYSNATVLTEDEKLAPNPDITGSLVFKSFVATACASLILSVALCGDKILYRWNRDSPSKTAGHRHWLQAIHMIETALHALSDQQLVAGISLLFILNDQACTISAYDFNLVCTMLMISVVVHLSSLVMISDFIFKGKTIALIRICSIAMQLVLTGIVFSARNSDMFPIEPQSLAIMPAACFENTNATDAAGLADFLDFVSNVTANATLSTTNTTGSGSETLWHNIEAATSATHGLTEYVVLVVFVFFALVVLLFEWLGTATGWNKAIGWGSVLVSLLCTVASVVLIGLAFTRFNALTNGMKVPALYQLTAVTPLTLSQILPLTLLASTILPTIHALTSSLPGRARRYITRAEEGANSTQDFEEKFGGP